MSHDGSGPTISPTTGSPANRRQRSAYNGELTAQCSACSAKTALCKAGSALLGSCRGLERGFRLLGDLAERGRITHGQVGQDLPVELDPRLAAAGHELVVREPFGARGRVDAHDPQPPERALLVLPVAVRVYERMLDLLLGDLVPGMTRPEVALRLVEDLLAALARC